MFGCEGRSGVELLGGYGGSGRWCRIKGNVVARGEDRRMGVNEKDESVYG